jgi:predicted PurR-regulated permease PerM
MNSITHGTAHHFFMGLLLAMGVVAFLIFLPFLTPLVFAISLAVIFTPVYKFLLRHLLPKKEKSTVIAFITLLLVAVLVLVPAFFIVTKMYAEIQDMYIFLTEEGSRTMIIDTLNNLATGFSHRFFNIYPDASFDSLNVTDYLQQGVEWAFGHVDTLFTRTSGVLVGIFITFFALFYFIRDGREFKKQIIALSPLMDRDDEHIFKKLEQAVYSVVGGSLIVGVIQGILTGIGFGLFHVPEPAVWGTMAAVAALIPGVGTSLVIVPGILYLFFNGNTSLALGLLVWGLLAVGLIDNLLGPVLVNRGIKIHPFIILLSVLGGIAFFGIVGFILGPLIFAFLFALLEIYKTSRATL